MFFTPILFALALAPIHPTDPTPEAPVRKLLMAQQTAWNAKKLDEFMAPYAADVTFYSGDAVTTGKDDVTRRYRKNYVDNGNEMGTLTFSDLSFTPLAPDVMLARGRWKVQKAKSESAGLFTLILKQTGGQWQIHHDHTSKGDTPAPGVPAKGVPAKKESCP